MTPQQLSQDSPTPYIYIYIYIYIKGENGDEEEGREWRLPGILYAYNLVLCGALEEDLRAMLGRFVEVCSRIGLKLIEYKSNVLMLGGEE